MTYIDSFLKHYGKKGMKWGSRKSGSSSKAAKKKASARPKAKSLSDDELRKVINRLQMEKQYNSLTNNSRKAAGAEFAKSIGKNLVRNAVTAYGTKKIGDALTMSKRSK